MLKIQKIKLKPIKIIQIETPKPTFVKVSLQGKTKKSKKR